MADELGSVRGELDALLKKVCAEGKKRRRALVEKMVAMAKRMLELNGFSTVLPIGVFTVCAEDIDVFMLWDGSMLGGWDLPTSDVGTFHVEATRKHTTCYKLNDDCTCGGELEVSFLPLYIEHE